jgi:hypothetical protein
MTIETMGEVFLNRKLNLVVTLARIAAYFLHQFIRWENLPTRLSYFSNLFSIEVFSQVLVL